MPLLSQPCGAGQTGRRPIHSTRLTVRGEGRASTETVPAPAGQGAIRVHVGATLVVALPNRNAGRRDAGTVECRDDFCHGLLTQAVFLQLAVQRRAIDAQAPGCTRNIVLGNFERMNQRPPFDRLQG